MWKTAALSVIALAAAARGEQPAAFPQVVTITTPTASTLLPWNDRAGRYLSEDLRFDIQPIRSAWQVDCYGYDRTFFAILPPSWEVHGAAITSEDWWASLGGYQAVPAETHVISVPEASTVLLLAPVALLARKARRKDSLV